MASSNGLVKCSWGPESSFLNINRSKFVSRSQLILFSVVNSVLNPTVLNDVKNNPVQMCTVMSTYMCTYVHGHPNTCIDFMTCIYMTHVINNNSRSEA